MDGKRIKVYTAAKRIYLPDDIGEIEVGYHLDIPGEEEVWLTFKSLPSCFLIVSSYSVSRQSCMTN